MRTLKRFYTGVSVRPHREGYEIALDGRPVRTPLGLALVLPTEALAAAVAAEWEAQKAEIVLARMPLTQIASTALDRVGPNRESFRAGVAAFGRNDLLCQRAEAPADLVRRQEERWDPLLKWAAERFGARLAVGAGVMPIAQPMDAVAALETALAGLDIWTLAALGVAAVASESLVLALAVVEGRIGEEEAFSLAALDEVWQNERWGEDREAAARRDAIAADLAAAARFVRLLGGLGFTVS
ncbi:MAG: ATPase [Rhodospirillales bacterium]|nr:ATPase [Rhodospirillales bacterium]